MGVEVEVEVKVKVEDLHMNLVTYSGVLLFKEESSLNLM